MCNCFNLCLSAARSQTLGSHSHHYTHSHLEAGILGSKPKFLSPLGHHWPKIRVNIPYVNVYSHIGMSCDCGIKIGIKCMCFCIVTVKLTLALSRGGSAKHVRRFGLSHQKRILDVEVSHLICWVETGFWTKHTYLIFLGITTLLETLFVKLTPCHHHCTECFLVLIL